MLMLALSVIIRLEDLTCGVLREDRRGAEPPESTVEHQLLFRLDWVGITGVSPHQDVHHRHLFAKKRRKGEENFSINPPVESV